jgi:hypothetical protein
VDQYLRNFIVNVLDSNAPLLSMNSKEKIFHWEKSQQQSFEELKRKINNVLILSILDFHQLFKLEIDVIEYALG